MAVLHFKDLEFIETPDKVKVLFLRHFYFDIERKDLERIGSVKVFKNSLEFDATDKRAAKFYDFLEKGLNNLTNKITGKKTVYIYKGSGIPLIGNGSFGIVDRKTSLIEIKPICGCNLSCIYCSVDEDRRSVDFLIEKDYLIDELKKVVSIKKNEVEIHIGCNGEPLLYAPLIELVADIKMMPKVSRISIDTNTTLLSKDIADSLIDAGMTRFNLSINAFDEKLAKEISGGKGFSVKHAKEIAEHIRNRGVSVTIAPVLMNGINDDEIVKIIEFAKNIGADVGIQNFLKYQFGKNPIKEVPMSEFYKKLELLEKKHNVKLVLSAKDFGITPDTHLKKTFRKDEIVEAIIVCDGRLSNEKIAKALDRTISVFNCNKRIGSKIKIRINREKHNIYAGVCV